MRFAGVAARRIIVLVSITIALLVAPGHQLVVAHDDDELDTTPASGEDVRSRSRWSPPMASARFATWPSPPTVTSCPASSPSPSVPPSRTADGARPELGNGESVGTIEGDGGNVHGDRTACHACSCVISNRPSDERRAAIASLCSSLRPPRGSCGGSGRRDRATCRRASSPDRPRRGWCCRPGCPSRRA